MTPDPQFLLIHGAATGPSVWRRVLPFLDAANVVVPERACSGDMSAEIADLAPLAAGRVVVGVSGGATIGLELAQRGVGALAFVLHEPAAGTLAPGLLAHVRDGLSAGGVDGFGKALYGPAWDENSCVGSEEVVKREFAMFGAFEPATTLDDPHAVRLTVGAYSPPSRVASVRALAEHYGCGWSTLPGAAHAAHLEAPRALVEQVLAFARSVTP